ncbi:MAG: DUF4976 domain-containing protein [Chloroflexi bacterium]|nr:MAG: DUF4976 domain-containing protein [Chloroflexota bacterium]
MEVQKDNVLVLMSDDHAQWAMGAYGNQELHTPNLDYLAQTGVQMMNAFTPTPVCSPSRACFFTGRLASQHGIHDYLSSTDPAIHHYPWLKDETTLAQLLSDSGYQTGLCGKWHLGADESLVAGFDYWFGLSGDYPMAHDSTYRFSENGTMKPLPGYKTPIITDHAVKFLQERDKKRPFFLFVGYTSTHSPWEKHPERLAAHYRNCTFDDIPKDEMYSFGRQNTESVKQDRTMEHELKAQYYTAVSQIDEGVGRLLDELEAQGLREDTLVIYTADHGLNCGHHGIWGKGNGTLPLNMVEESIRIPMIFNKPGHLFGGQRRSEFVDHTDLFQTVAEYAEIPLPDPENKKYPGRSFLSLLDNSAHVSDWRDVQFGEYGDLRMIRTQRYKLLRRHATNEVELFDLYTDPRETINLASNPKYNTIVTDLSNQITSFFETYEDAQKSGLRVRELPRHNVTEAWRAEL